MKIPERTALNLFFAFFLAVILIATFISYRNIGKVSTSIGWISHTTQVLRNTGAMLLDVFDLELDSRSFLISGDTSFIEKFDEKSKKILNDFNNIKTLVADNPQQLI